MVKVGSTAKPHETILSLGIPFVVSNTSLVNVSVTRKWSDGAPVHVLLIFKESVMTVKTGTRGSLSKALSMK